jgi:phosphoglycolate phosphatase
VALWYPAANAVERRTLVAGFDVFTADEGASKSVALPGSREAVASLHEAGFRMGIATNDSTRGAERTLAALGLAGMFDAAYGYDAVANPKPAPDTVRAFCDLTGLRPAEVAIVGDNRHDLEMAHAGGAGLAIAVLSGTGTRETLEPLADVVLDSVADLPSWLARRRAGAAAGPPARLQSRS